MQQSSPFLITSVSCMDHGTISNHQVVWWVSLYNNSMVHHCHRNIRTAIMDIFIDCIFNKIAFIKRRVT